MRATGRSRPLKPRRASTAATLDAPAPGSLAVSQDRGLSIQGVPMSARKKIQSLRLQAFQHQQGRCWYCHVQMWLRTPTELPGLPPQGADLVRCTAEHLIAKCDEGRDEPDNIVAACARCNHGRHKLKRPPPPSNYIAYVHSRMDQGNWHRRWVWTLGLIDQSMFPPTKFQRRPVRNCRSSPQDGTKPASPMKRMN